MYIYGGSNEEVFALCNALCETNTLSYISVEVSLQDWMQSGITSSILSLCVEGATTHGGKARGLVVELDVGTDEVGPIDAELRTMQRSWAQMKSALERHGPCNVDLQTYAF